jgi:hypothetical protein
MDRIERAICKKLEPLLKQHGFVLVKERGGFVRAQPYGSDDMLCVNMGTSAIGERHFFIGIHFAIRHDRIEVPWNTLGLVYGEDNQRMTPTLVFGFPRPRNLPTLKIFPGSFDEDVAAVAAEGQSLFLTKGLPFFAEYSDLVAVEALANRRPLADLDPYTVGGPMEHRAMRSLLLAKAVNQGVYAAVREAFVRLDKGMFPREQRLAMLAKVDAMTLPLAKPGAGDEVQNPNP